MERPHTGRMLTELANAVAAQGELLAEVMLRLERETDQSDTPASEPDTRIPKANLFTRENMRHVAYAIGALGKQQIDTVLVENGWHKMEKLVFDISLDQYERGIVITEKQVDVLFDRLNKQKYACVAPQITEYAKAAKSRVEEAIRAWNAKKESARATTPA